MANTKAVNFAEIKANEGVPYAKPVQILDNDGNVVNKELMAKKEKMDQDYAAKLKALDTSISQQINEKAKADGYDLVLSKGIVLFGGNDITSEIIKVVK